MFLVGDSFTERKFVPYKKKKEIIVNFQRFHRQYFKTLQVSKSLLSFLQKRVELIIFFFFGYEIFSVIFKLS